MIATQSPQQRIVELLLPESTVVHGYLDVLGAETPPVRGIGQAAMRVPLISRVYEPIWREFFRLAMGRDAVGVRREKQRAVDFARARRGRAGARCRLWAGAVHQGFRPGGGGFGPGRRARCLGVDAG
ncbi:hypothetical protein [Nocardia sp. NPDC051981]|uniref:hypothetical protein n=1 Tax=Nocardia sp. NPDC051981 TaxID=3155417 RepID=UPI003439FE48